MCVLDTKSYAHFVTRNRLRALVSLACAVLPEIQHRCGDSIRFIKSKTTANSNRKNMIELIPN